ncbi:MAG: PilN domain-containing protein [Acidobacteriota bacterium]
MIKINLLGKERPEPGAAAAERQNRTALLFSLIVVATLIGLVWWYMHLQGQIDKLEADKAAALEEKKRLEAVIKEVEGYEAQKKALETKVKVIEELKKNQTGPVHMLDEISKHLPDFLWLEKMTQQGTSGLRLEGKATSYNAIADFITNLDRSGYFFNIGVVSANRVGDTRELYQYVISADFRAIPPQPQSPAPKPAG